MSNRTKIASIYVCQINNVFVWSRTDDRVRIRTFQNETPLLVINWSALSCAIVFTDPIAGNISISNARVHQLSLNFYRCDSDHKRKLFFIKKRLACIAREAVSLGESKTFFSVRSRRNTRQEKDPLKDPQ